MLGFSPRLTALDDDDREIVLLRHFEQLSNSEAAQALGLTEAAAGMRHLRALRRLRARSGRNAFTALTEGTRWRMTTSERPHDFRRSR